MIIEYEYETTEETKIHLLNAYAFVNVYYVQNISCTYAGKRERARFT